jgi:hypothetical protein
MYVMLCLIIVVDYCTHTVVSSCLCDSTGSCFVFAFFFCCLNDSSCCSSLLLSQEAAAKIAANSVASLSAAEASSTVMSHSSEL